MTDSTTRPQIGVSACLMGQPVRFDGGHKKSRFVLDECTQHFDLYPVCPEAELGLGIPRPVIQLRKYDDETRLVFSKQYDKELTQPMREFASRRIDELGKLDGFIFKKDSPSCGMERVPVYDHKTGMRKRNGVGIFADSFKTMHPDVPTEDEGRLNDKRIRENYLERVYAHYRWRQIFMSDNALRGFREFHKNYKLILMAKNAVACKQLGQLAASVNEGNFDEISIEYLHTFMKVMKKIPSHGQHVNVLMHVLGYLKKQLSTKDKQELLRWFESYRQQQVTRITPLVLLQHHFLNNPNDYIAEQYYFSPFPKELMHPV